jgi:hypothetical protein
VVYGGGQVLAVWEDYTLGPRLIIGQRLSTNEGWYPYSVRTARDI